MSEAQKTIFLHEAIEKAHHERAQAFKDLRENWFGLRGLIHFGGQAHSA